MAAIYSYTKPRFVRGQKLTADDLNNIVNLIEPQSQWTRRGLIGVGIACGLEISPVMDEIGDTLHLKLGKGAAVSSDGCLFYLQNDLNLYFQGEKEVMRADFSTCSTKGPQCLPVWEFGKEQVNGIASYPVNLPDDAIFLFVKTVSDNSGSSGNCLGDIEPTGLQIQINYCVYAVSKAAFGTEWLPGGQEELVTLPFPAVKRIRLFDPETKIDSINAITEKYLNSCKDAIGPVEAKNSPMRTAFQKVLGTEAANTFFKDLIFEMDQYTGESPFIAQYYWAYLKDLVAAFEEWALARTAIGTVGCVDEGLFPNFISLGNLAGECRMDFYPVQCECDAEKWHREILLRKRLAFLTDLNNLTIKKLPIEIKITGSQPKHLPLSQLAIPFYYKNVDDLRQIWNYDLSQAGRWALVPSYHRYELSKHPLFKQQLCYDLERYDFYRVEGHIGKDAETAFNEITIIRDELNLPFKIVLVSLEDVGQFLEIPTIQPLRFSSYASVRPGLEHMGGVVKGGTLVLVYGRTKLAADIENFLFHPVVADFCLPYCHEGRPAAMFHVLWKKRLPPNQNQIKIAFRNDSLEASYYIWEAWTIIDGKLSSIEGSKVIKTDKNDYELTLPIGFTLGTVRVRLTAYLDVWESHYTEDLEFVEDMELPTLKPTALFHEVDREYTDQGQSEPLIRIILANDSVNADGFEWSVPNLKGVDIEEQTDERLILKVTPNPKVEKLRIILKATNSDNGLSDEYEQVIGICPKDLTFLIKDPLTGVFVEEILLSVFSEVSEFELTYSHKGCILSVVQDSPIFEIENNGQDNSRAFLKSSPKPGVYTFICKYPCNQLERQTRIIYKDFPTIGQDIANAKKDTATTPAKGQPAKPVSTKPGTLSSASATKLDKVQAANKGAKSPVPTANSVKELNARRNHYRLNVEALAEADRKLAATKSYKNTHHFITTPPPSFADWHKAIDELSKLLLNSATRPGGASDDKYLQLLKNAIWHYLDRSLAEKLSKLAPEMESLLRALVPGLEKAGVAPAALFTEWKGLAVQSNDNQAFMDEIAQFFTK